MVKLAVISCRMRRKGRMRRMIDSERNGGYTAHGPTCRPYLHAYAAPAICGSATNGRRGITCISSRKSIQAGDGLADDERVDIVRTFVGVDRLQVVRVAADWGFEGDAISTKDGASLPRRFAGLA